MISARDFVSWYNGLPQNEKTTPIDLSGKRAIIIGAGNVAIDIARILLSPVDKLAQTDISASALEVFRHKNKIEHVTIVARRGILNAAFTLKELRELSKIDSVQCQIEPQQFKDVNIDVLLGKLARPRKRITEFMLSLSKKKTQNERAKKTVDFVFLKTPVEILGDEGGSVTGVKFTTSRYDFDFSSEVGKKFDTEEALNSIPIVTDTSKSVEILPANLIIRSIG